MYIFVRRIPEGVSRRELTRFVDKATSSFWRRLPFVTHPQVEKCEILRIEDLETHSVEYHGLISVQPAKAALSLINRLNGERLHGKAVEVRKYYRRSSYKDRRRRYADGDELSFDDRRHKDRRRPRLRIRTIRRPQIEIEGLADFSRTYL